MIRFNYDEMMQEIKEDEKVKPAKSSILTQEEIAKLLKDKTALIREDDEEEQA